MFALCYFYSSSFLRPLVTENENLFLDTQTLAAAEPYDADQIVTEAMNANPAQKIKRVKRKRGRPPAEATVTSGDLQASSSSIDMPSSSTPPKKRYLSVHKSELP